MERPLVAPFIRYLTYGTGRRITSISSLQTILFWPELPSISQERYCGQGLSPDIRVPSTTECMILNHSDIMSHTTQLGGIPLMPGSAIRLCWWFLSRHTKTVGEFWHENRGSLDGYEYHTTWIQWTSPRKWFWCFAHDIDHWLTMSLSNGILYSTPPPDGYIPDFNRPHEAPALLVCTILFTALAAISTGIRVYTRARIVCQVALDDCKFSLLVWPLRLTIPDIMIFAMVIKLDCGTYLKLRLINSLATVDRALWFCPQQWVVASVWSYTSNHWQVIVFNFGMGKHLYDVPFNKLSPHFLFVGSPLTHLWCFLTRTEQSTRCDILLRCHRIRENLHPTILHPHIPIPQVQAHRLGSRRIHNRLLHDFSLRQHLLLYAYRQVLGSYDYFRFMYWEVSSWRTSSLLSYIVCSWNTLWQKELQE